MMMTPQTMYFFRDELEKQAIFTPTSAVKAMNYAKPGMFGNAVRKAGQMGFKAQQFALDATPAVTDIANNAYLGTGVAMGTLKGHLGRWALGNVPTPSVVPTGVAKRAKSALTWESRNSPLETTYNPVDLSNFIPTPSF